MKKYATGFQFDKENRKLLAAKMNKNAFIFIMLWFVFDLCD